MSAVISELTLANSIGEAPVPSNSLSELPELIVEASSALGLKSKQSLNAKTSPLISEVYAGISL